jgi:hypothetical protein
MHTTGGRHMSEAKPYSEEGKYHGFNNRGVALVYLRMESQPSDFTSATSENKWFNFAQRIMQGRSDRRFLTKWGQIQGDYFTAEVLETIKSEGE